jgi:serine-type D-Ala-D-Ala carboxypeptidase (penicillin-binding protein 5/6)
MLKTKIYLILPYWLTVLLIIITLQTSAVLFYKPTLASETVKPPTPAVLGSSIDLRGSVPAPNSSITQLSSPDLSGLTAKSFLVFDLNTGQNLIEYNTSQKLAIASLTKLMTGLVTYQNVNLSQPFAITNKDILNVSPSLGLKIGDQVLPSDVFNAMLIGSCNDAALALGNLVSSDTDESVVNLMNQEANSLSMSDTSFANPMGFDSSLNYSTASDLKTLITYIEHLTAFTDLGRKENYSFTGTLGKTYSTIATDRLIKNYTDLEAIKTGYTTEAGGEMATKLDVGGQQVVILVLGSQDREADTLKLRSDVLGDFQWN